jgi:hypothetical protein
METVEEPVEPHPFLALVLARMASSPEEFVQGANRWASLIESSKQYLTAEEKKALKSAEREVTLGHLHTQAMKKLLADKPPLPRTITLATLSSNTGVTSATYQSYDDMFEQILRRLDDLDN